MIFQHTINQVLDGTKTQTRRLAGPEPDGTGQSYCEMIGWPNGIKAVQYLDHHHNLWIRKWQVGSTYAAQPGRGQKAVGRIRITDIRRERVQDITEDDAVAEGIRNDWYIGHNDKNRRRTLQDYAELWDTIHTTPGTRWSDNPLVWVISFCLVEAT